MPSGSSQLPTTMTIQLQRTRFPSELRKVGILNIKTTREILHNGGPRINFLPWQQVQKNLPCWRHYWSHSQCRPHSKAIESRPSRFKSELQPSRETGSPFHHDPCGGIRLLVAGRAAALSVKLSFRTRRIDWTPVLWSKYSIPAVLPWSKY